MNTGQVAPPWKLFSNHLIRERCILVVDWSNIAQTSQSKSLFRAGATFLMNAVNTDKSLLKKARDDKHDPLLSILEWRNTQTEGIGAFPTQLLYDRRTRTHLRVARKQLKSTLIEGVTKMMEKGQEKQKRYFD